MTTVHGMNVRDIVVEVARPEKEPATILLQRLEEKIVRESLLSLGVATLTLVQVLM